MERESLEIARGVIIKVLSDTKINEIDKVELMINIDKFLREYDLSLEKLMGINKKR